MNSRKVLTGKDKVRDREFWNYVVCLCRIYCVSLFCCVFVFWVDFWSPWSVFFLLGDVFVCVDSVW